VDNRLAFEQWWRNNTPPEYTSYARDKAGNYRAEFVQKAWEAWQAAQAFIAHQDVTSSHPTEDGQHGTSSAG
jgi:hypothetical protein